MSRRLFALKSSSCRNHKQSAGSAKRPPLGLKLESLEDRSVPAVFNVNSLADVLTPPNGVVTLRSAIEAANATPGSNTINLDIAGTYKITQFGGQEDANVTGDFDILDTGGTLTIQNNSGGKVVINGEGIDRVFDVNPTDSATAFSVNFNGLTITGGVASPLDGIAGAGGGIRAQGAASLVLNNDVIIGNSATANGGGVELAGMDSTGTLVVNNCTISKNQAGDAGGGINTDGVGLVTINGGTMSGNTCVNQGAAVWLNCNTASLNMTGVVVSNNVAFAGATGAIGNAGTGAVSIVSCLVENNSSGTTGGGFGDQNMLGNLTIIDSQFIGNTAGTNGGAIQAGGPNTTTIIEDSVIEGNTANSAGGGVFLSGGTAIITDTRISNNTAVMGGGLESAAPILTLTNDLFEANHATATTQAIGGFGGAADVTTGKFTVANSLFLNNSADGGMLFVPVPGGNEVGPGGGAINQSGGSLTISNSQFSGNLTTTHGGAIFDIFADASISGSTFSNNEAGDKGGAIAIAAHTVMLTNDTIVSNSAATDGGAIWSIEADVTLQNDTINQNTAGGSGGGIFAPIDSMLTFQNTIISGNTAGKNGNDVEDENLQLVTDGGGNLIGDLKGSFGFLSGTKTGVNPLLGPLENNGGSIAGLLGNGQVVQTEALLLGSPAIGAGVVGTSPALDARGFARIAGGRALPSIGAYEPHFAVNATPNQVYVESLYETLLNETGDANAPNLVNQLNHHTNFSNIVQNIENTNLFKTNEAQALYERYFHATATGKTLQNYVNQLGGGSPEQAEATMLGSTQYFQLHGSNNTMFVDAMFEDVLGRLPDDTELATDLQSLANGKSRQSLAQNLLKTSEYFMGVAETEIVSLTGSEPDSATLIADANQLQHGQILGQLVSNVLGSTTAVANRE